MSSPLPIAMCSGDGVELDDGRIFVGIQVPFDRLVNIIYVINGYVGIILIGFMVVKTLRGNLLSRAEKAAASA